MTADSQGVQALAAANGWEYSLGGTSELTGLVFRDAAGARRHLHRVGDVVRIASGPTEIGNSAYSFSVNLSLISVTWGYATVPLPHPVPALVVETSNALRRRPLPALPTDAQTLALGADGTAGTAYVTGASRAWAQRVLDPELCALLNDPSSPLDVEIRDARLFVYAPYPLAVADQAVWRRTLAVLDAVRSAITAAGPASDTGPHHVRMTERAARVASKARLAYYGSALGLLAVGIAVAAFWATR